MIKEAGSGGFFSIFNSRKGKPKNWDIAIKSMKAARKWISKCANTIENNQRKPEESTAIAIAIARNRQREEFIKLPEAKVHHRIESSKKYSLGNCQEFCA